MGLFDSRMDPRTATVLVLAVVVLLIVQATVLTDTHRITVEPGEGTSWTYEFGGGEYTMWEWHTEEPVDLMLLEKVDAFEPVYIALEEHNGTHAYGHHTADEDKTLHFHFENDGPDAIEGTLEVNNNLHGVGLLLSASVLAIAAYFLLHGILDLGRSRRRGQGPEDE